MIKELIKAYMQTRLNAIDAEIEGLAEVLVEEEEESKEKGAVAQATFDYSRESKKRIAKLSRRIQLYKLTFGEIK